MSIARHCDRDGCDSWKRIDPELMVWGGPRWITVDLGDDDLRHFDTLDCLTHWAAAHSIPTETYGA
ncbi:hypothetical protein ACFWU5_16685 [Nocardia sp. NPDC058640]|uniref:hypothetical protein n=1 Tax=Nocardia sp. NPDC058640 TaxID=3346571 RepID=UPI0036582573